MIAAGYKMICSWKTAQKKERGKKGKIRKELKHNEVMKSLLLLYCQYSKISAENFSMAFI